MLEKEIMARKKNKEQQMLGTSKINKQDQEYMKFKNEV